MTTKEFILEHRKKLSKILKDNRPLRIAALTIHKDIAKRIFVEGGDAAGGDIGRYDTIRELYVNPAVSPKKFPTKGKTGRSKFNDGKPHKTGYFKSYKDYRQRIGRKVDKVNLVLTGQLQSDFASGIVQLSPHSWASEVKNKHNKDKIDGNEERFTGKPGGIFSPTKEERKKFVKVINEEITKILTADA